MKVYSTINLSSLMFDARALLKASQFRDDEIPSWWVEDAEYIVSGRARGMDRKHYWRSDLTLFAHIDEHRIYSPYSPAHRALRGGMAGDRAATWTQWGLVMGALFKAAENHGATIRFPQTPYDAFAKYAPKSKGVRAFDTDEDLFHYRTCDAFQFENWPLNDLNCRVHRWVYRPEYGKQMCTKCGQGMRHL